MDNTIFDQVKSEDLAVLRMNGYDYNDANYINVYRWMWDVKGLHPIIESFPGDTSGRTMVKLQYVESPQKPKNLFARSFDDAVIKAVDGYCSYLGTKVEV